MESGIVKKSRKVLDSARSYTCCEDTIQFFNTLFEPRVLLTIASSFPTRRITGKESGFSPRLSCRTIRRFESSAYTRQRGFLGVFQIKSFIVCDIFNMLVVSKHVLYILALPRHILAIRIGHMLGAGISRHRFFGSCWMRHTLIYIQSRKKAVCLW